MTLRREGACGKKAVGEGGRSQMTSGSRRSPSGIRICSSASTTESCWRVYGLGWARERWDLTTLPHCLRCCVHLFPRSPPPTTCISPSSPNPKAWLTPGGLQSGCSLGRCGVTQCYEAGIASSMCLATALLSCTGSRIRLWRRLHGIKSSLHHLVALRPWESHIVLMSLSVLICRKAYE